jgi:hypothetical protein
MADEVNQAAFEGGDTAPGTKEQIHERNKAMQEYVDTTNEIAKDKAKSDAEAYDAAIKAEAAVAESTQALVTGAPVGAPDVDKGIEKHVPDDQGRSSVAPKK